MISMNLIYHLDSNVFIPACLPAVLLEGPESILEEGLPICLRQRSDRERALRSTSIMRGSIL